MTEGLEKRGHGGARLGGAGDCELAPVMEVAEEDAEVGTGMPQLSGRAPAGEDGGTSGDNHSHPGGALRVQPARGRLARSNLEKAFVLTRVMLAFCVTDLLVYVPTLIAAVVADMKIEARPAFIQACVATMAFSQVVVLFRCVTMGLAILSESYERCFRPVVYGCLGLIQYFPVMAELMVIWWFWRHFEGGPPLWKAAVLRAALTYNGMMFICHFSWLYQLNGPDAALARLAHAAVTRRFAQLGSDIAAKSTQCGVCLEDFDAVSCVLLLPCGHVFHQQCGQPWLASGHICPYRCSPPEAEAETATKSRLCHCCRHAP